MLRDKPREALLFVLISGLLLAQPWTVSAGVVYGTITDKDGQRLPRVKVVAYDYDFNDLTKGDPRAIGDCEEALWAPGVPCPGDPHDLMGDAITDAAGNYRIDYGLPGKWPEAPANWDRSSGWPGDNRWRPDIFIEVYVPTEGFCEQTRTGTNNWRLAGYSSIVVDNPPEVDCPISLTVNEGFDLTCDTLIPLTNYMVSASNELRGWVDMHAHPMAHLGLGGKMIHGTPDVGALMPAGTLSCDLLVPTRASGIDDVLTHCGPTHMWWEPGFRNCGDILRYALIKVLEEKNEAASRHGPGFPNFPLPGGIEGSGWRPNWSDITHQKMWIDWVYRAYRGGQRVMVALAINSRTLALVSKGPDQSLDRAAGDLQIAEIKQMVRRHGFMEIAQSPAQLRDIVRRNKLAIVLGLELDDLGDFTQNVASDADINAELERLHGLGIRYVFPVHLTDNRLAGSAVYNELFNVATYIQTGQYWQLTNGMNITFQFPNLRSDYTNIASSIDAIMRTIPASDTVTGPALGNLSAADRQDPKKVLEAYLYYVLDREVILPESSPACPSGFGHVNAKGLSSWGTNAINKMMQLGMLIDIDHMSDRTVQDVLGLTQANGYALNSGHNGCSTSQVRSNENSRTWQQYSTLAARGGMFGVGLGTNVDDFISTYSNVVAAAASGNSGNVWLGLGTDMNGLYHGPQPPTGAIKALDYTHLPRGKTGLAQWDYNLDGVAHYGLLPDFLVHVGQRPGGSTVLSNIFCSAEGFARMWEKCVAVGIPAPQIAVEQPAGTKLSNGGPEVNCGAAELGAAPTVRTFTVRNAGTASLIGLAVSKDGTHQADFTIGPLGATELAPGASTTFNVAFTPGAFGQRRATIHLASNDADQNPFDVSLVGAGISQVTITTLNALPPGTVGAPYRMPFGAGGGAPPLTWSVAAGTLPAGLTLSSDGILSGTPTTATSGHFTTRVESAGKSSSASRDFDLRILAAFSPGALDTGFADGGHAITTPSDGSARGYSLAVQNDGKIVVAGAYDHGGRLDFALGRFLPDGQLDPAFGTLGVVTTDFGGATNEAYSVGLQSDGKIVAAGYVWNGFNYFLAVARFGTNGTLDTSFGGDGKVTTAVGNQADVGQSVVVQSDGRIVVGGRSYNGTNNDFALVRYESNGQLDASFGTGGKVTTPVGSYDDEIRSAAIQSDGKIVVAGSSRKANEDDIALARYHPNGTLDTEFGTGGKVVTSIGSYNDIGCGVLVQSDGKIVAGGYTFNGSDTDFALVRYRADGTRDSTFGNDGLVTTPIGLYGDFGLSLALQSDGKIIVAGHSVANGNYDFALARYLANGSLDTTFGNNGKLTSMVGDWNDVGTSVAVQPDGKILVAGYSDNASGRSGFALVRYLGTTEPEIAVEQPQGNNLTDGSTIVSFGNQAVPDGITTRQITVRNASSATLTGLAVSKDGINASDFALGALGATTLAPGASTTLTVSFTPGELGPRTASLHIASNDADENPFDLAMTGKGVLPPQILTTAPLPSGIVGVPYSVNLAASGGTEPYTWSVSSGALPTGLGLSSLGVISGTPSVAGIVNFSVRVLTDESLEAIKQFAVPIYETITWTNVAGGNWTDKANWSPNKVPSSTSLVLINLPGTYTVTLDYNAQCHSLQVGGAPGTQSLNWKYGTFAGTMTVETNAVVNLIGGSLTLAGVVDNRGRVNWPAGQLVTWHFDDGSILRNRPGGLLDLQGHGSFAGTTLASIVHNEGTIRKSFDAAEIIVYMDVGLVNAGVLDVQTGTLELQGLESSNVVSVASGAVVEMTKGVFNFHSGHRFGGTGTWWVHGSPTINGVLGGNVLFAVSEAGQFDARLAGAMWWTNGTWSGNLTVDTSGVLNFESMKISGVLTNYGCVRWAGRPGPLYWEPTGRLENMGGGTMEVTFDRDLNVPPGGSLNNYGTILKSGGTNQSSFRGQYGYTNYGLIDVRVGRLEFLHGLDSSGTINVAQNASLELHGYDVNLGPEHKFTGQGTCTIGASTLHITGPLDGTVTFQMEYATVFDSTLNAPMVWKSGNPSGNLTVGSRGVLTMLAPGDFTGNLTNHGTVLWQSPQTASWRWGENTRFYNAAGALFDMQGDHRFYGWVATNTAFENAGIFRKSKGAATAFVDASFAFTNSGALEVQSGKIWFRSPFTQTASGSINVYLGGMTPITQYSQVQFDKAPIFAGRILAGTSGGFRPVAGASFTVLSYPSATGGFSPLNNIDLGSGLSLTPQVLPTSLVLTAVQSATLPSLAFTQFPGTLRITVPDGYSDWRLYSATNIANPIWELVPLTPGTTVDLPTAKRQEFFRLQGPW